MSVLFYPESIRILGSDANGNNVILCTMAVDDIANLPAANAFISDGYVLSMGCKAIVINDNSKHRLNSQDQWVQIAAGTSTYTRAEIDAIVSDLQNQINYAINTGAKNLLPMSHTIGSATRYGVTCTWNNDGTMTLNGAHNSGDSASIFEFYDGSAIDTIILPVGLYSLTGCPAGGSASTYRATLTQITGAVDIGNGATFELSEPHYAAYRIIISGDCTFINTVFRPMIRQIGDDTFEPYAPTNRQLYEMILELQGG